jgi:hypothetical protein
MADEHMDADFIQRNQIIERYLSGRLPARGAQDFEQFCRANPQAITGLGLAEQINAGLRLLEAAGRDDPWAPPPLAFWQKPRFIAGLTAAAGLLLIGAGVLWYGTGQQRHHISTLQAQLATRPLQPVTTTRALTLTPVRGDATPGNAATLGRDRTELADLKIDVSWSRFTTFRLTVDQVDHGRVMVLGNLQRDSSGHLRVGLNSSALRPGRYTARIEGLDRRGNASAQGAFAFTIAPR